MIKELFLPLIIVMSVLVLSCDHKQELNEINRNLADAANWCNHTAAESPQTVYNNANFAQLCDMGGWPVNFSTAKYFCANSGYNNSSMAEGILENASRISYSINAHEVLKIIEDARSNLQTASKNYDFAREFHLNSNYEHYLDIANKANDRAIKCIEHARRILYQ